MAEPAKLAKESDNLTRQVNFYYPFRQKRTWLLFLSYGQIYLTTYSLLFSGIDVLADILQQEADIRLVFDPFLYLAHSLLMIFMLYIILRSENLDLDYLKSAKYIVLLTFRIIFFITASFVLVNWILRILVDIGLLATEVNPTFFGHKTYLYFGILDVYGSTTQQMVLIANYCLLVISLSLLPIAIYLAVIYVNGLSRLQKTTTSKRGMLLEREVFLTNDSLQNRISWTFLLMLPSLNLSLHLLFAFTLQSIFNNRLSYQGGLFGLVLSSPRYFTQIIIILLATIIFKFEVRSNLPEKGAQRIISRKSLTQIIVVTGLGKLIEYVVIVTLVNSGIRDTIQKDLMFTSSDALMTSLIYIPSFNFVGIYDLILHLLTIFETGIIEAFVPFLIYLILRWRKNIEHCIPTESSYDALYPLNLRSE